MPWRLPWAVLAVFLTGVCTTPARACYTGLVNIPTAEVIEPGQYGLELQFDGAFARGDADTRILNTELGLSPRFEAGVDFDLSHEAETRTFWNAKYLLSLGGEKCPAFAIGVCNVGHSVSATPYLVATQQFRGVRGHLGAVRVEDHDCWFIGLDHAVNDKLTLMADSTSGSDNSATVGANYQFTDAFGIMAGAILPNSAGGETGFTVHFVLNGPFRHIHGEK
jgi:hypothetical protein